jgi:dTDP-4-dehydrorhamnose reductase
VDGTANLAKSALVVDAEMIYISTDYVFGGSGEAYYEVDDPKAPQSVYGRSKLAGEDAMLAVLARCYVVRTSWVFVSEMNKINQSVSLFPMKGEQPIGIYVDCISVWGSSIVSLHTGLTALSVF